MPPNPTGLAAALSGGNFELLNENNLPSCVLPLPALGAVAPVGALGAAVLLPAVPNVKPGDELFVAWLPLAVDPKPPSTEPLVALGSDAAPNLKVDDGFEALSLGVLLPLVAFALPEKLNPEAAGPLDVDAPGNFKEPVVAFAPKLNAGAGVDFVSAEVAFEVAVIGLDPKSREGCVFISVPAAADVAVVGVDAPEPIFKAGTGLLEPNVNNAAFFSSGFSSSFFAPPNNGATGAASAAPAPPKLKVGITGLSSLDTTSLPAAGLPNVNPPVTAVLDPNPPPGAFRLVAGSAKPFSGFSSSSQLAPVPKLSAGTLLSSVLASGFDPEPNPKLSAGFVDAVPNENAGFAVVSLLSSDEGLDKLRLVFDAGVPKEKAGLSSFFSEDGAPKRGLSVSAEEPKREGTLTLSDCETAGLSLSSFLN